jgi:hypothetical protein
MQKYRDRLFGLNDELSIWVEEEDLGKERVIRRKHGSYSVRIPQELNREITLRLKGLGKTRSGKTGDLLLHVWLNKGEDVKTNLWLSETSARNGTEKTLLIDGQPITMVIPPKSHNGLTIRLKDLGREASFSSRAPALDEKKKGSALVKLCVYPDQITPKYESFEALSYEDMTLEGWVYRKFDEVIRKLGRSAFPDQPVRADEIADLFNECGWNSIFDALVEDLNLKQLGIELATSASDSLPGCCERIVAFQNATVVGYQYRIRINEQFLDSPFAITAILAHELCHVIYSENIDNAVRSSGIVIKTEKAKLEEERTVDLLVFMFQLGEFQLRVARDKRITLGYFNQDVFERMHVIVARKLRS